MRRLQKININTQDGWTRRFLTEPDVSKLNTADDERWNKMAKNFKGGKLLDLGCLNSNMANLVKEKYKDADVYETDFIPELIDSFARKFPDIRYEYADCNKLPYENGFFDHVTAGELIEHMDNPSKSIREWVRVLKKGGTLSISTPNNELLKQQAIGGEWHVWAFEPEDMRHLLGKYGDVEIEEYEDKDSVGQKHFTILAWLVKI